MEAGALEDLLRQERFGDCTAAAEGWLQRGGLTVPQKALVFWALTRSLTRAQAGQEAIGPGELAVHFSRESGQYDLLGQALVHLASVCFDNRLHRRALLALEGYFHYYTLYGEARGLEGRVFHLIALCDQATGRPAKAVEYHQKAYRWHTGRGAEPQQVDWYRAALAWQYLQLGQTEPVNVLLRDSEAYLLLAPNDLDARVRLWNNRAYLCLLTGDHRGAIDIAIRAATLRGAAPGRKAQAFLILHYTAKAMGCARIALGIGVLAKVHATVARRVDVEEEVSRSMFQMQQQDRLPLVDELFQELSRISRQDSTGQCPASVE
ncbi:MAG TPA: hypothetical protein VGK74_07125 [Symbiobacteriaceae bacterium]|jgi:tetratricopeptide (TPR) repeat protein